MKTAKMNKNCFVFTYEMQKVLTNICVGHIGFYRMQKKILKQMHQCILNFGQ